MFPTFARVVEALRPKAIVIENVKGLLRRNFADYFKYIVLRLSHPTVRARAGQTWRAHRAALEPIHTASRPTGLDYNVVFQLLNAADYGVPQRRERVFFVGFRSDLEVEWSFPQPTHSFSSLPHAQFVRVNIGIGTACRRRSGRRRTIAVACQVSLSRVTADACHLRQQEASRQACRRDSCLFASSG
jgi:site-specific DNA-cytosine methylase